MIVSLIKKRAERGVSLRRFSWLMLFLSAIIMAILLYTTISTVRAFDALSDATGDYIELAAAADDLMDASDYLTEEVQRYTVIGDRGVFRECVTVSRACGEGNETRIGNDILMMAYTHIAHNCIVGNNVIMSNVATLAGHVIVEDRAVIGGLAAVHQFCRIGRNAMAGGMSRISQDIPPFMLVAGDPAFVAGLNSVGLARAGMPLEIRTQLKKAFRILYRSGLSLEEAVATMEQELDSSEPVEHLMRFLRNAERGIIHTRK